MYIYIWWPPSDRFYGGSCHISKKKEVSYAPHHSLFPLAINSRFVTKSLPSLYRVQAHESEDEDEDGDEVEDGDGDVLHAPRGKPHKPLFPRKALCWNLFNVVVLGIDPLNWFLDLGQSDFSYSTCKTCGLFYARGHGEDEKLHSAFHMNCIRGIPFKVTEK